MKIIAVLKIVLFALVMNHAMLAQAQLERIATFPESRPGNITVANDGRIFVTMSALSASKYMVKEILPNGDIIPFGDKEWIVKPENGSIKGINSTIGIQADANGKLWVLDMGNIKQNQAPKLVGFDLVTGNMVKVFPIPNTVLSSKPFLQDFVIDVKNNTAIIADMTDALNPPIAPAFVVINLETGYIRRVLEGNASFLALDEPMKIHGRLVSHKRKDGTTIQPRYPLNPISIDEENKYIYYGAMGNTKIYRIQSAVLADESKQDIDLTKYIELYANKPKSDGFKVGANGKVYVTDVENSAIVESTPSGMKTIVQSKEDLSWPDGVAIHGNYLYIVANQLHNLALLNEGKDASKPPYLVLKMKIKE
ncbi:L-dopachrome tautomerase-related protein [Aquimarina sp. 2-A2]|uniref:L-dopachrome tautomerase-related protein n=1 Tax=Aquimarina sp. 2-A2 TaxID=3382644 RepID=UPI00387EEC1B